MLDVAIVGGGLCGLALAHGLAARRIPFRLYEARERFGGRILSLPARHEAPTLEPHGAPPARVDLGPTWFWPDSQPSITRLIEDLGLPTQAQLDDGRVRSLTDPNREPAVLAVTPDWQGSSEAPAQAGRLHGGAQRLSGGMAALTEALIDRIHRMGQGERLRCGHALQGLRLLDDGSGVELTLRHGAVTYAVQARQVVLALPPRLALERVSFAPALEPDVVAAMAATATWMATAAKAALVAARPFWREAGSNGNAWVSHAQAVLAEVFDACVAPGEGATPMPLSTQVAQAALAGFFALSAEQRQSFAASMPLLLQSQFAQLFGLAAQDDDHRLLLQDWAREDWTCSALDRAEEGRQPDGHPPMATRGSPRGCGTAVCGWAAPRPRCTAAATAKVRCPPPAGCSGPCWHACRPKRKPAGRAKGPPNGQRAAAVRRPSIRLPPPPLPCPLPRPPPPVAQWPDGVPEPGP